MRHSGIEKICIGSLNMNYVIIQKMIKSDEINCSRTSMKIDWVSFLQSGERVHLSKLVMKKVEWKN